jgi:prophage maintenance system killer protein
VRVDGNRRFGLAGVLALRGMSAYRLTLSSDEVHGYFVEIEHAALADAGGG